MTITGQWFSQVRRRERTPPMNRNDLPPFAELGYRPTDSKPRHAVLSG